LRVAFCGDSVGAQNGSYANQAVVRLFQEFSGKVRALNTSHGGATTQEFKEVWQPRVMDYNPNLVVFQLSYNDAFNGGNRLTPDDVVANYRVMIDSILAKPGGRVVILSPLSFDKKRVDGALANGDGRYPKGTDLNLVAGKYIAAIEKMVADYQANAKNKDRVAFVNIFEAMAKVRAEKGADYCLLADASHPGKEGQAILFDALWPELKRMAEATLKDAEGK
jgi:lysophospholipase L1-like esterase